MVTFILSPSFIIYSKDAYSKDIYTKDIYRLTHLCYNADVPENKKYKKKPNLIQIDYWLNNTNNV